MARPKHAEFDVLIKSRKVATGEQIITLMRDKKGRKLPFRECINPSYEDTRIREV